MLWTEPTDDEFPALPSLPLFDNIRSCLVALAEADSIRRSLGPFYRAAPELGGMGTTLKAPLEFASYLRNKFAAHIVPELVEKALEWRPELRAAATRSPELWPLACNAFLLETAINTYTTDGTPRFFDSDTDLIYPPDSRRFRSFILETSLKTESFLDSANSALQPVVAEDAQDSMLQFVKAAKTDFSFLKRRGNR